MKYPVYNQKGEKVEEISIPDNIFGVKMKPDLLCQAIRIYQNNKRQGTAHTKTRANVSGGGKKPWRQKGTGRARHSSIRSPIWIGGGVTFGPEKEKVYSRKLPKKMKRLAFLMALSEKARTNSILILDKIELEQIKTKWMAQTIDNLRDKIEVFEKGSVLLALDEKDDRIVRVSKNIPKVKTMEARELNSLDLLSYKYLVMPKRAIEVIKETFLQEKHGL